MLLQESIDLHYLLAKEEVESTGRWMEWWGVDGPYPSKFLKINPIDEFVAVA